MTYILMPLPYKYDSLEPIIDERTMSVHHDGHHKAYVEKLNAVLEKYPRLQKKKPEELIKELDEIPEEIRTKVRNFGGGVVNHDFLWPLLKKETEIKNEIKDAIDSEFGNFENFKKQFSDSASTLFGSGYTWLVLNNSKLEIMNTSNQDSPLSLGKIPILTIDMWEHAYYLKHQNKKADYIEDYFKVINWDKVNENYIQAIG